MRRLSVTALLVAAGLFVPGLAHAEVKVAVIDVDRALSETDDGKAANAQFEREVKDRQKKVEAKEAEIRRADEDLKKQALVLTEAARAAAEEALGRKYQEYQAFGAKLQQELLQRQRELTAPIIKNLNALVQEMAAADGFTLVLDRKGGGVIFAQESLDLTNELIRKYNARYAKKGAPAAAPKK